MFQMVGHQTSLNILFSTFSGTCYLFVRTYSIMILSHKLYWNIRNIRKKRLNKTGVYMHMKGERGGYVSTLPQDIIYDIDTGREIESGRGGGGEIF